MAILKKQDTAEGAGDKNLFYRGELSETTVTSLLLDALEERLSGTLTLLQGTVRKVIHLHQGRLVHARSSLRRETFGQMLINKGLIQPAENAAALRHSRTHKTPYDVVLFKLGVMKQDSIDGEMTDNVRQIIENCLIWRSGSWMFIGDEEAHNKVPHCPLDTLNVVFHGFQRCFNEDEVLVPLMGKEGMTLKLLPRCVTYREPFVASFGSTLLSAAAAGLSLGGLMKLPNINPESAALQIAVLQHTGMAQVRGEAMALFDSKEDLGDEFETRHSKHTVPVDLTEVAAASVEMFDPVEFEGEPLFADDPTPIVAPAEVEEPFFADDPTPIVDPPEIDEPIFGDDPTPIVDPPCLEAAPPAEHDESAESEEDSPADSDDQDLAEAEKTVEPEPTPPAAGATEPPRGAPVVGRSPTWLMPLLTFVLGAATASAFFMVYAPAGTRSTAVQAGRVRVSPRVTGEPAAQEKATERAAGKTAEVAGGKETATPAEAVGRKTEDADSGAMASAQAAKAAIARPEAAKAAVASPETAKPETAKAEAASPSDTPPASKGGPAAAPPSKEPPAIAAGLTVAAAMRPCLSASPNRTHLISAHLSTKGRVNRAFVAKLPGASSAVTKCIKQKLRGITLPLRLRKDGYMEWRIRFKTDPPTVVVRPKYLRNVIKAGK